MQKKNHSFIYRHRYMIIFGIFLVVYFLLAYHLVFNLHYAFGDAVSRTEKPFLVLYDNEPKLAAIGFIWPPLPSLVQIPVLAIFKQLSIYGFAGKLVTVFFGALNVVLIYLFIEKMPIKYWEKTLLIALYGFNPMIAFYAINGMSETTFLFFVIAIAWNFYQWQQDKKFHRLLLVGIFLSGAFLTRYETFALTASLGGLIFLTVVFFDSSRNKNHLMVKIRNGFNIAIFALLPVLATIFAWVGVNWLIMGDPFYFFHGNYSVSEQSQSIGGEALATSHNILQSIWYSYKRIALLFPVFSILFLTIILSIKQYSWSRISMLLLAITIPTFEIFVHYLGKSFGWLRFFIYIIPFSFILLSVIWNKYEKIRVFMFLSVAGTLLLSGYFSGVAMLNGEFGKEEHAAAYALAYNQNIQSADVNYVYVTDINIVNYLKEILKPGERVLIDDFLGYGIVLNYGNPKIFINNSDKEFDRAVDFPEKYANYILIPSSGSVGIAKLDIFNRTYPDIYKNGMPYLTLVKEFDGAWKLYHINKSKNKK